MGKVVWCKNGRKIASFFLNIVILSLINGVFKKDLIYVVCKETEISIFKRRCGVKSEILAVRLFNTTEIEQLEYGNYSAVFKTKSKNIKLIE